MEFNSFLDEFENLSARFCRCHAARQIGDVCAKTGFALFDDDGVFHNEILFQTGLFENGVERANRNVNVWFSSNGNRARFGRVFELTMATFRSSQVPSVLLELSEEVANFHARMISDLSEQ